MMLLNKLVSVGQAPGGRGLAASHPVLRDGVFSRILVLALFCAPCLAAPPPLETIADDDLLLRLQSMPASPTVTAQSSDELARQIQHYLQQARSLGDPRYLGYAKNALQRWPTDQITPELRLLRASLRQSLHQFDDAQADLEAVIAEAPAGRLRSQAWLTLSSIQLVQGHYVEARAACKQLAANYPGLITASCDAQVAARTGHASEAYDRLARQTREARRRTDPVSLGWAEGTLGNIAAQLGLPEAEEHWRHVLALNPEDLYTRVLYADWLLQHDRPQEVMPLTQGYEKVDSLSVLRAIALAQTGESDTGFTDNLEERFVEARWRGNLLHKRDYARFLLDVENQPEAAFEYARKNWRTQREPLDTRLLMRSAQAAGKQEALQQITQWLAEHKQADVRYPEVTL